LDFDVINVQLIRYINTPNGYKTLVGNFSLKLFIIGRK